MDWLFGDYSASDSCTEGGDISQENISDTDEKDHGTTKLEGWGNCFSVEEIIWKFGVCMVLNQKGGTKCSACGTE